MRFNIVRFYIGRKARTRAKIVARRVTLAKAQARIARPDATGRDARGMWALGYKVAA